jgi:hypothetical protein
MGVGRLAIAMGVLAAAAGLVAADPADDRVAPEEPNRVTIEQVGCERILVTWESSGDLTGVTGQRTSGLDFYTLLRRDAAGAVTTVARTRGGERPHDVGSRRHALQVPAGRLEIGVSATDRAGNSTRVAWSSSFTVTTSGCDDHAPPPPPTNLEITRGPGTCTEATLKWDGPRRDSEPNPSGLRGFNVYRDQRLLEHVPVRDEGGYTFHDSFGHVLNRRYVYAVRTVDREGLESAGASGVFLTPPDCRPFVPHGVRTVEVIGIHLPGTPEPSRTVRDMITPLFFPRQPRDASLGRYFSEASYGRTSFRLGSYHGWYTLPGDAGTYCNEVQPDGSGYGCNEQKMEDAARLLGHLPPSTADVLLLIVSGSHNQRTSGTVVQLVPKETDDAFLGVAAHEFSHTFGPEHSGSWEVPGYPAAGPDVEDLGFGIGYLRSGVSLQEGDPYSPLGIGHLSHLPAYLKQIMGFLDSENAETARRSGEYEIGRLEDLEGSRVKELRVPLAEIPGAGGAGKAPYYSNEYRTPRGYDARGGGRGEPFEGLLIRIVPEQPEIATSDTYFVAQVKRGDTPAVFYDPFRKIGVALVSADGTNARVRVCGIDDECLPEFRIERPRPASTTTGPATH